jgi:cell wall-associated NlpC family hydrolase
MTTDQLSFSDATAHSHTVRSRTRYAYPVILLVAVLLLASPAPGASAASRREAKVRTALSFALAQKGDPYRWGANGPNAFDCSGLVQFAIARAHLSVPRTSRDQARAVPASGSATPARKRHARRGDLVF